jgi:hypothetical protein
MNGVILNGKWKLKQKIGKTIEPKKTSTKHAYNHYLLVKGLAHVPMFTNAKTASMLQN